jgi:hypothetical protein
MKRRQFMGLVGSFAAAWSLAARAQQPERVRRIGVLMADPSTQSYVTAFRGALTKLGWAEGSNLRTEVRWSAATSCHGSSRHIASPHYLGRKRGIAEIDRPPSGAEDDARDPNATLGT